MEFSLTKKQTQSSFFREVTMDAFINRDFKAGENEDFANRVQTKLTATTEAVPQYVGVPPKEYVIGWKIQSRFE